MIATYFHSNRVGRIVTVSARTSKFALFASRKTESPRTATITRHQCSPPVVENRRWPTGLRRLAKVRRVSSLNGLVRLFAFKVWRIIVERRRLGSLQTVPAKVPNGDKAAKCLAR